KVKLKATFPNEDGALFPNQFVNARLLVETLKDVVVVPTAAAQLSPDSTFVWVVKPAEAAEAEEAAGAKPEQQGTQDQSAKPDQAGGKPEQGGKPTQVVEMRTVKMRQLRANEFLKERGKPGGDESVVEANLEAGEVVVTDGVDKLQDKTKVTVSMA